MRNLLALLLTFACLFAFLTACAETQNETAAVDAKTSQGARLNGSENMPQGQRMSREKGTDSSWTAGEENTSRSETDNSEERGTWQKAADVSKTEGEQNTDKNSEEAEKNNNDTKMIIGTVQSIVGNEVVLTITKTSDTVRHQETQDVSSDANEESAIDETSSQKELSSDQQSDSAAQSESVSQEEISDEAQQEITQTYLIPVGMSIGGKDFTAIKVGNTLRIYFGTNPNDGSEIITAVELR